MRSATILILMHAATALAAGDPTAGQAVFTAQCAACHSLDPADARNGPTLHAIANRKSASIDSFDYSDAMSAANLTWDPATLDTYLQNPRAVVPGTKMAFPGLPDATQRGDLIAYLSTLR